MQVTTLNTQLGLSSEIVDWYRDATSVPFGHLLIVLSPRQTVDYHIEQTVYPFRQKFIFPNV